MSLTASRMILVTVFAPFVPLTRVRLTALNLSSSTGRFNLRWVICRCNKCTLSAMSPGPSHTSTMMTGAAGHMQALFFFLFRKRAKRWDSQTVHFSRFCVAVVQKCMYRKTTLVSLLQKLWLRGDQKRQRNTVFVSSGPFSCWFTLFSTLKEQCCTSLRSPVPVGKHQSEVNKAWECLLECLCLPALRSRTPHLQYLQKTFSSLEQRSRIYTVRCHERAANRQLLLKAKWRKSMNQSTFSVKIQATELPISSVSLCFCFAVKQQFPLLHRIWRIVKSVAENLHFGNVLNVTGRVWLD